MQKVLITGGAGFIGSHLVAALRRAGHAVRVLDSLSPQIHGEVPRGLDWLDGDGIEFARASILDAEALRAALDGVTSVVHLAAETGTGQSMYEVARYNEVNTQGTAALMQELVADRRDVGRVLLASSRSVYGEGAYVDPDGARVVPGSRSGEQLAAAREGTAGWDPVDARGRALSFVPTREDDRTAPASIYAATKLAQEDLVRIGCEACGMGWAALRLQNVYGEGQSLSNPYTGILSIFSTRIRRGIELPIFEDGRETRDFVHVSDVAAAFLAALERAEAPGTAVNVGSGRATSVVEVAEGLSRAFGATPNTVVTGQYRIGDIRHNAADTGRLGELLGLRPAVSLDDGLGRFARWVNEQPLPEDRLDAANEELRRRKMMA